MIRQKKKEEENYKYGMVEVIGRKEERIPTELALKKNWQEIITMLVTAAFEC